jgi:O-antigen/teichoic acid export membrane protein
MGIVAAGVVTRYLGLDSYGQLVAAIGFTSIASLLTDLGISTVGSREIAKHPEQTQRITGAIVTAGLALSLLGLVIGVILAFSLYGSSHDAHIRNAGLILLSTLPLTAFYAASGAYFVSQQQAWKGMVGSVVSSVVQLMLLLAASLLDWGFTAVVLTYVCSYIAQWAVMLAFAAGQVRLRPTRDWRRARQLLGWALPLGFSFLLGVLYWRADIVLLSKLSTQGQVGIYGLAYKMVDGLAVLGQFVLITLIPEFARLADQSERFNQIFEKSLRAMLVGALAICVPVVLFATQIADVLGGQAFDEAGPVLQLLMVGVGLGLISAAVSQAIISKNEQKKLVPLTLWMLAANIPANVILIPIWGARGSALAFAFSEAVHLIVICWLYRRIAPFPKVRGTARILLAGAAMCAALVVKLIPVSGEAGSVVTIALGVPFSIALFVGTLYALRAMPPEMHDNVTAPIWTRVRPALGLRGYSTSR